MTTNINEDESAAIGTMSFLSEFSSILENVNSLEQALHKTRTRLINGVFRVCPLKSPGYHLLVVCDLEQRCIQMKILHAHSMEEVIDVYSVPSSVLAQYVEIRTELERNGNLPRADLDLSKLFLNVMQNKYSENIHG